MNRLSTEQRTRIVSALVEGNSLRSTCRMTGAAMNTVLKLLAAMGEVCVRYQDDHVRNIFARRVQCDEIWSFCHAKAKNVPDKRKGEFGYGDVWAWTHVDADGVVESSDNGTCELGFIGIINGCVSFDPEWCPGH